MSGALLPRETPVGASPAGGGGNGLAGPPESVQPARASPSTSQAAVSRHRGRMNSPPGERRWGPTGLMIPAARMLVTSFDRPAGRVARSEQPPLPAGFRQQFGQLPLRGADRVL